METPFHVRDARARGLSPGSIRSSRYAAPFHGVRVGAGDELTFEALCRAYAVKMRRDVAFSHETAAALYGAPLPAAFEPSPIHVSAPLGTAPVRGRGVVGHHHPQSVAIRAHARWRLTDPVSTWIALASSLGLADLVAVGDAWVTSVRAQPPLTTIELLRAGVAGRPGFRGAAIARRALAFVRPGAASRPESLLRVLLESAGVPPPVLNLRVNRLRVVLDLAWPDVSFAIEYDGGYHRHPTQYAADIARQERVQDAGWVLMRVTKESLFGDPRGTARRVRSRLAERGLASAPLQLSHVVIPRP